MKYVPLTQGYKAMVDDEDYVNVMKLKWTASVRDTTTYALHHFNSKAKGRGAILLHRFIMNVPKEIKLDHEDRNGLNCQKYNLRIANNTQNGANRIIPRTFQYRGIYKYERSDKENNRWQAMIRFEKKLIHIGMYINEEDAALAYDAKAKELFGEFAVLNFPEAK